MLFKDEYHEEYIQKPVQWWKIRKLILCCYFSSINILLANVVPVFSFPFCLWKWIMCIVRMYFFFQRAQLIQTKKKVGLLFKMWPISMSVFPDLACVWNRLPTTALSQELIVSIKVTSLFVSAGSWEAVVPFYQSTQCHILKNCKQKITLRTSDLKTAFIYYCVGTSHKAILLWTTKLSSL
jgi:hypothetical protein